MSQVQQSILNKQRKDKFILSVNLPSALKKIDTKNVNSNLNIISDSLQFSIWGTTTPDIEVPGVEIRYAGSTLYNSSHGKNSYPPVTVKFTIDNRFNNYWVIYQWLNLMHDQVQGLPDVRQLIPEDLFDEYQADLTIIAKDEFDQNVIEFTYTKAFPTSLGGIIWDYRDGNEAECSFTFVYSQLHINKISI
jgi:hypothetical protein